MLKKFLILIAMLAALGAGYWIYQSKTAFPDISGFDECAEAGYPIMESYPRQCRTPDGKNFTEDISNELEKTDLIRITSPRPNAIIKSSFEITGQARGFWFFEATFPVKLLDEKGNVIASHYAQAQGEWMTEDFVPFSASLSFEINNPQKGVLILEKDNPSGLPENADELRLPVFLEKTESPADRQIKLYYYNENLDKDELGNILCSRRGLAEVERSIPLTQTPVQDAVKLLLEGQITNEERGRGIRTEFPLDGFELKGASLANGILTLEFFDPSNKTVGGACRVGILWFQIERTARQFPEVNEVLFLPEDLFQP